MSAWTTALSGGVGLYPLLHRILAGLTLLAGAGLMVPAEAGEKLVYMTWSGYELPEFHQAYLANHPEGIDVSLFGDDDEALTKVKAGFRPDVAHPCFDKIGRWREENLLQPIDVSRIANWDKVFPVLKTLPGVIENGEVWMIPWDWGNTSITYRTDLVDLPEASWKLLWDQRYAGRLATLDAVHDTPVVAAILAGVDPFNMSGPDLEKVANLLKAQRPLLRMYTTDMTSVEQALAAGELVAAMTWNASAVTLKRQGLPVEFMNPKEGMLTWVCGYVLLKDAQNLDLAYDFINARLADDAGKYLVEAYGYGSSNQDAFRSIPAATLEELALPADPETMLRSTVVTGPMRNNDAVSEMFENVKAGG